LAQSVAVRPEAGVVTSLSGQADIARPAVPQPIPLRQKDAVFKGDRIATQEKSLARLLLGGKALVTIRELSTLTLADDSARSTMTLTRGNLALAVLPGRMGPGEAMTVRTPHAVGAVRGTVLLVLLEQPVGPGGEPDLERTKTTYTVLEGSVEVRCADDSCPPAIVRANEGVTFTGRTMGDVHPAPKPKVAELLDSFKISTPTAEALVSEGVSAVR
jgi:hypothetical protein